MTKKITKKWPEIKHFTTFKMKKRCCRIMIIKIKKLSSIKGS